MCCQCKVLAKVFVDFFVNLPRYNLCELCYYHHWWCPAPITWRLRSAARNCGFHIFVLFEGLAWKQISCKRRWSTRDQMSRLGDHKMIRESLPKNVDLESEMWLRFSVLDNWASPALSQQSLAANLEWTTVLGRAERLVSKKHSMHKDHAARFLGTTRIML